MFKNISYFFFHLLIFSFPFFGFILFCFELLNFISCTLTIILPCPTLMLISFRNKFYVVSDLPLNWLDIGVVKITKTWWLKTM